MSDMPDFDSMTPEEMMKWMESLAKRQGATEGLTTDADMDVAEVAADDERLAGQGDYIPYGWTEEKWKERLAKEEEEKKAKQGTAPAQPVAEAPTPPPVQAAAPTPPAPIEQPAAQAAPAADAGTPDFDSMTPEEMMKWMESLAKRQGATEGLTTSADMQVAEVSQDDERLAGQGDYIPYGWTEEKWKERLAKEEEEKRAKQGGAASQPAAQAPTPAPMPEPEVEEELEFDFGTLEETGPLEVASENPMDWLSSLGAPEEGLPNLDLNLDALGDLATAGDTGSDDPMSWLSSLGGDSNDNALESLSALGEQSEEGSLAWMESLAAEQGAPDEELVTAADLDIPFPQDMDATGPGYQAFSFENATGIQAEEIEEAEEEVFSPEAVLDNLEDPESWLDSLASGGNLIGGDEEELDFDFEAQEAEEEVERFDELAVDVKAKLDSGTASPEEIEQFFMHAFTKAAGRDDVPDYVDSEDEEDIAEEDVPMPIQAEIPDWLRESMETSTVEEGEAEPVAEAPAKTSTAEMMVQQLGLDEEAAVPAELPDWLTEGVSEDTGAIATDIFEMEMEEEETVSSSAPAFALDTQDSWVEAFAQEESGELAEWYEEASAQLDNGEVLTATLSTRPVADVSLQAADLPEESLAHGNPMNIPDWLGGQVAVMDTVGEVQAATVNDMDWLTTDEAAAVDADMPDWLRDNVDESVAVEDELPEWLAGEDIDITPDEIPDWLRETVEDEEEISVIPEPVQSKPTPPPTPTPAPTPTPPAAKPVTAPVPVRQSPAPVPVAVANIDVAATLNDAKSKVSSGDIDGAMLAYEQVVRANASLDVVESALTKLVDDKNHKGNPAVHRVLGDTLMRQGKLQQALDTYRKALNML